ncbi:hypothetical protein CWE09_12545 [Aliidiomarina minuta]|uniref:Phosphoenolpyruvate carboxylase n=1 Tax=Aliidiomarina minuta TaxID=880057 RepID=A0A432W3R5_9GAMM|nr:hypothetical protein [Aliidiomarina minuta]RUO23972.1 hypothetical protein CWE09_12545 [Aliidiomarina minuta]
MDEQQLASNLLSLGSERLALIGKHSKALMQGYLKGEIDETQFSERALKRLVKARLLYQPDESRGLVLSYLLNNLIASMVEDEQRRSIHADTADKLESIRTGVSTYREAQYRGDYPRAELQLQLVTEQVHNLAGQFEEAIDSLWHRLNSNFGFVSNLADKIRENERAQNQIRRLLDGLSLINFNELIELGEGNATLRKLLVTQLQTRMNQHHGSLLEVQKRLVQLMGRFREQQARSLLVSNMAAFLRQHPGFQVGDYAWRSQVPELINQAAPILPAAAIALDRSQNYPALTDLLKALPAPASSATPPSENAAVGEGQKDEEVAARQQALKNDVESFYLEALERDHSLSSLQYLSEQNLDWDAEIWLFQVLAEHQGLPVPQRKVFKLQREEVPAHIFNDLRIIEDVSIQFQGEL